VKFLVDNQLPVALSRFIVSLGCDCLHAIEAGLAEASDAEIWRFACETERIVISKDEDFLYRASKETATAGLIWVRLGNCRTATLLAEFERLWPRIQASLNAGDRIIELR
jgi:predicted nuclease of predicted toxin-antitoxin system